MLISIGRESIVICYVLHVEHYMFVMKIHFLERWEIELAKRFTVNLINVIQKHF